MNRHEKRKQDTRHRILAAAADLIIEKGYEAMSISELADRADVGRATFYLHFADKIDVVRAIIESVVGWTGDTVNAAVQAIPSPRREYLSWVKMFELIQANHSFYSRLQGPDRIIFFNILREKTIAMYEANLSQDLYYSGSDLPVPFLARFAAGAILEVVNWWVEINFAHPPEQMAAMLFEIFYRQSPPDV